MTRELASGGGEERARELRGSEQGASDDYDEEGPEGQGHGKQARERQEEEQEGERERNAKTERKKGEKKGIR